jgi:hypothetical protein
VAYTGGTSVGIAFLIGAASVAEFVAKDVSSPQTVHLNAKKRAPTLMWWVHVGMVEATFFTIIAAMIDRKHAAAFVAGAILEMGITEAEYLYARKIGMQEINLPATEEHNAPTGGMGNLNG